MDSVKERGQLVGGFSDGASRRRCEEGKGENLKRREDCGRERR